MQEVLRKTGMTCLYYAFYSSPLSLTPAHPHKPHTITTALADMVPVRSVPLNHGNLGKVFLRCPLLRVTLIHSMGQKNCFH